MNHEDYMRQALELAQLAYSKGDIPIGALIVKDGQVLSKAYNTRENDNRATGHAEILAIEKAADLLGTWNLSGCTLYVTVEPCPMCAGAAIQTRIDTIVFGCDEPNSGSFGSIVDLSLKNYNHKPEIVRNVLNEECSLLMKQFFIEKRKENIVVKRISEDNWESYLDVRKKVFVEEQNVSLEEEIDDLDGLNVEGVIHIGAFKDKRVIGTARLISNKDTLVVGRVSVLKEYRNQGVGNKIMKYAQVQAENNGYSYLALGAQLTAIPFYQKSGYVEFGDEYLDANIKHMNMKKKLKISF